MSPPACRQVAGPAPSRQGWRVPRPRFAACGLDRLSPARQGLAKQVRHIGSDAASSQDAIVRKGVTCPSAYFCSNPQTASMDKRDHRRYHAKLPKFLVSFW